MSASHLPPRKWSRRARMTALIVTTLSTALLLEGLTRVLDRRIASDDRLDPGLVSLNPQLGWNLSPSWRGSHRHVDFKTDYSVDHTGFRSDPHRPSAQRGRQIAVLGDSFTFGIGVSDHETFVSLLNQSTTNTWLNFSVPGYSNDQELLLLESEILRRRPDSVLFVVYLGNDLLDNPRSSPLQLNASKPFFILTDGALILTNVPVSGSPTTGNSHLGDIDRSILGPDHPFNTVRSLTRRSAIARRLMGFLPEPNVADSLPHVFSHPLALFEAIMLRARNACRTAGCDLQMLALVGRSALQNPASISGQYQHFLRAKVAETAKKLEIPCIDPYPAFREQSRLALHPLYFPNEGHLTPIGHQIIAEVLHQN